MKIFLYNTMSGTKEEFAPQQQGRVKMYCCGVTPYDHVHIGHARTFASYDLLYRTLRDHQFEIDWARNITDIDDKIISKSNQEGVHFLDLVKRYVDEQDNMLNVLCVHDPKHKPRATEHIPQIIDIISRLIQKELAYANGSGVYYRVKKFAEYGKLSKNKVEELRKGARIEIDENKEDPLDFALWKIAKPGEPSWPSPWGEGRPGWHIECSAMIHSLFGETIDIHMGGRDLRFPHHEAEIAQSEGLTGKTFAKYWMHTGMMTLDGQKMSKSTANYVSLADFLSKYPSEVLRLIFLSASYSQPLDFTLDVADQNLKKLARIYRFIALVEKYSHERAATKEYPQSIFSDLEKLGDSMREQIADDLNTSAALAKFFDFIRSVNNQLAAMEKSGSGLNAADQATLKKHWKPFKTWLQSALALITQSPEEFFESLKQFKIASELSTEQIETRLQERQDARLAKDWAKADIIRNDLLAQGIQIQDTPKGTRWTVQI
jgi:cysteinyl-tRNA synthetase